MCGWDYNSMAGWLACLLIHSHVYLQCNGLCTLPVIRAACQHHCSLSLPLQPVITLAACHYPWSPLLPVLFVTTHAACHTLAACHDLCSLSTLLQPINTLVSCRKMTRAHRSGGHATMVTCGAPTASATGRPCTTCGQLLRSSRQLGILWRNIQS